MNSFKTFRSTLLSLFILMALVLVVNFILGRQIKKEEDAGLDLVLIDLASIDQIEIKQTDKNLILKKQRYSWMIQASQLFKRPLPADPDAINLLIQGLSPLKAQKRIQNRNRPLKDFGLDPGMIHLTVAAAATVKTIIIGDPLPMGQSHYAKVENRMGIFVLDGALIERLSQPLRAFRLQSLWDLTPGKIDLVKIQALQKMKKTHWQAKRQANQTWQISLKPTTLIAQDNAPSTPPSTPQDPPPIDAFLTSLNDIKITAYMADFITTKDLKRLGLDPPAYSLLLTAPGQPALHLLLGPRPAEPQSPLAAHLKGQPFIYGINPAILGEIEKQLAHSKHQKEVPA